MTYAKEKQNEFTKEAYEQYREHVGDIAENNSGRNNDVDAYRHAYVSARLTQLLFDNQGAAEIVLDAHEVHSPNAPYEHRMDGWNNEVGRRFGDKYSKEDLGEKLAQELKPGGLLATTPDDIRLEKLYSDDSKIKDFDPISDNKSTYGLDDSSKKGVTTEEMDKITDDASREIGTLIDARDKEDTVSCIDNIELMEEEPFDSLAYAEEIALSVYNPANDYVNDNDIARA